MPTFPAPSDLSFKVQHPERREGLPIRRHLHEKSDSVYAYRHEIDAWRNTRHISKTRAAACPTAAMIDSAPLGAEKPLGLTLRVEEMPVLPKSWLIVLALTMMLLITALTLGAYGLAIVAFGLGSVFVVLAYPCVKDTIFARAAVALFLIAGMSFVPSAWTLSEVMATVVNIETLKPAMVYPFVTGLKFIPLLVLILAYWVILRLHGDAGFLRKPSLGKAYFGLGLAFLSLTWLAIASHLNDYRIWQAGLPGRWEILIGYAVVFAINLAVWLRAYVFFKKDVVSGYRGLFALCGLAYMLIALPAGFVDWQYNQINRHYLNARRSDAYVVARPEAIEEFRNSNERSLRNNNMGNDLRSLLNDREFVQALRSKTSFKQNFDEPFQVFDKAVMFGYQIGPNSPQEKPVFMIIRFPEDLASALRFQFVGEEKQRVSRLRLFLH